MWLPVSWLAARLASGTGETFKNVTAGVASISTVMAIIVGAIWAWFKFIRGRTFRPRVSVEMLGQWRPTDGQQADTPCLFHARVRITNIGAAKVTLKQYGTGLNVSFPLEQQPSVPHSVQWQNYYASRSSLGREGAFQVLEEVEWIEPGETVSDDLLLNLGAGPSVVKLELHLVWSIARWYWRRRWKAWRRVHRWIIRCRIRNRARRRRVYNWCTRRRIYRWPPYRAAFESLRAVSLWFRRVRRKKHRKLRRWACHSMIYKWIYRRPDDDFHHRDVEDFTRRIIPADSTMVDDA